MRAPSIPGLAAAVAISWLFVGVAGLAGAGCSNQTAAGKGNPDGGAGVDAAPLPGTPGGWTWVDVPGMGCDDGSPTGVAVNPAPGGGGDLFIYFMGGGACWDASTCFVLNTSVHGPFGQAQWDGTGAPSVAHALDRARATNPFRDDELRLRPLLHRRSARGQQRRDVRRARPAHVRARRPPQRRGAAAAPARHLRRRPRAS